MFKDCKCGRSIPAEWPRCGECAQKRTKAEMRQRMEGKRYDDKVSLRHSLAQSVAVMRGKGTQTEPQAPSASEAAVEIERFLQRKRAIMRQNTRDAVDLRNLKDRLPDPEAR